ncbi:hypothetical protein EJ03DRAFT_220441 [Teratosphaeria nubilosa]|uniref:Uncharacterized protein n=1 Tax=Teratosphaeria nubilosa TaxID=161662 RepID=A0A6G1KXZ3_9PEZI|nr:hypothetical protein EJ03DRAFT_220441 [Teratosphaeria nubilosa]
MLPLTREMLITCLWLDQAFSRNSVHCFHLIPRLSRVDCASPGVVSSLRMVREAARYAIVLLLTSKLMLYDAAVRKR